jgi:hypothetical protein
MSSTFKDLCGQNIKGLLENNAVCVVWGSYDTDGRDYDLVRSDALQFGKGIPTRRRHLNMSIKDSIMVIIHQIM